MGCVPQWFLHCVQQAIPPQCSKHPGAGTDLSNPNLQKAVSLSLAFGLPELPNRCLFQKGRRGKVNHPPLAPVDMKTTAITLIEDRMIEFSDRKVIKMYHARLVRNRQHCWRTAPNRVLPCLINQMFFINLLDEKLSPRSNQENYILRMESFSFD